MSDQTIEKVEATVIQPELQERLNAKKMLARAHAVKMCYTDVMKKGLHYGKIPGCGDKPTLLKPGAEKLLNVFQYAPQIITEDLSGPDEKCYRVRVRVTHILTGLFVGEGVGECSSNESKYKWEAAGAKQYSATEVDRRREKIDKYGKTTMQVRTEHTDKANTVLKMAKKRAMVDAALTCTGASDMFEQDLEDMDYLPEESEVRQPPKATAPKPTENAPPAEKKGWGSVAQIGRIFGIGKSKGWSNDDILKLMQDKFGWSNTNEIDSRKSYEWICEHIEKQQPGDFDPEPEPATTTQVSDLDSEIPF